MSDTEQAPGVPAVPQRAWRAIRLSQRPYVMWLAETYSSCKGKITCLQENIWLVPLNRAPGGTLKHAKYRPFPAPD